MWFSSIRLDVGLLGDDSKARACNAARDAFEHTLCQRGHFANSRLVARLVPRGDDGRGSLSDAHDGELLHEVP
jgi:hypothetical protein